VTAGQVVLGSACLALIVFIAVQFRFANVWLSMGLGVVVGLLPYVALRFMRSRRLNQFEAQFPEAVDLIARTLRAGHAFPTGLKMAAEELPQPVAAEFKTLFDQQNYGMPIPEALRDFANRTPLIDARFFVTAVLTQREAGGNLAEVLDNLAAVIRERFKVKRQLRVISAHGRLTGAILASLPPFLAVYMMIRMPQNFGVLLTDPLGQKMLIFAVVMQLIGAVIIRKITAVDY
jgi:tight adherence protein B